MTTSNTVISVENVSKRYLVGHRSAKHGNWTTMRDTVVREARNFVRKAADFAHGRMIIQGDQLEEFWALRDVSFNVKQGDAIGIIGRNGAGKSTLLKILSRITEPTEGRVLLRGRVASLLEVGTGFHFELTGRENIFLNGAILGMTRREVRKKFDEIVAFADVERFLDTPVKRYSSGMYVRLAFSIAAHLEPEILIVDEVLAVGDTEFQKKCLGKMNEVARQNRTVLFVSHNMATIRALTQKCILMHQGRVAASGNTDDVIDQYVSISQQDHEVGPNPKNIELFRRSNVKEGPAKITRIGLGDAQRYQKGIIPAGEKFTIEINLTVFITMRAADFCIIIKTAAGDIVTVFACSDFTAGLRFEPGDHTVEVAINDLPLGPGDYLVLVSLDPAIDSETCDTIDDYPLFSVANTGRIAHWLTRPRTPIQCQDIEWTVSGRK